ncbi:MAG: PD40 domain-containing protein [Candidatus Eremiobacteraeota bacterium]|nr:PD40 domain-containing protein [Candidatus Eremiobacteraeota bacterium]MBC5827579.1 PD40 domain-containing protein [Candidatus Eremiobacteraeota bacterium]
MAAAIAAFFILPVAARSDTPYLFQNPTLSASQIAFEYGGEIWTVDRAGGQARRLVTGFDLEGAPYFSPDGSRLAFSGNYDGNIDVYVVPSSGGDPRRLTYHPGADVAVGWTPDGKNILFRSARASYADEDMLYTVPITGGFPKPLPLGMAEFGSYSADATHLAYVPTGQWEPQWQRYRGGQTTPIWIADLADSSVTEIPRDNTNDRNPMWVGGTVYFLSDRSGPATLYAYDTLTRRVRQLMRDNGLDFLSANAGPGGVVYAQLGSLHLYDIATQSAHTVPVTIAADLPQVRPHWMKVGDQIQNANISPSGVRAVFESHGDIFTVPALHGDVRNITNTPTVADRDPAWSPDGRWIAYFSDRSGEYALHLKDQKGLQQARVITLPSPSFFYTPTWSPDSKKIAYSDKHMNLWYVDIDHPRPVRVDTAPYEAFGALSFNEQWSPDSRWLTYNKQLSNFLNGVFVYSIDDHRPRQITDGMSDSRNPVFDQDGRYLYFLASTNTALTSNGLDMTSDQHPTSSNLYMAVLKEDSASPVKPQSDEERVTDEPTPSPKPSSRAGAKGAHASSAAKPSSEGKPREETPQVSIDFDGLLQRIISLPVPAANYVQLNAGEAGQVFLLRAPLTTVEPQPPPMSVLKFDLHSRKTLPLANGVTGFALSFNGKKMLVNQDDHWSIVGTEAPADPGEGAIATDDMELQSQPRQEWAQMYHETWRIERDFFYDKHFGGLNIARTEQRFAAFLPGIGSRNDLSFLLRQMLSYLSTGHLFVNGGAQPPLQHVNVGLLGADYSVQQGRYRFAKIYSGQNWNPELQAPLTQPGATVHAGEYLLAVNGRPLHADQDVYSAFEGTAGKQIVIKVGPSAEASGSRDITVTPVRNEGALRNYEWIDHNRAEVDRLSGGKLGYVYLPDTQYGGFTNFNRYFFAQVNKQGVILDERFNHGGQIADYIIDMLQRKPMGILVPREGRITLDPPLAIYGPKVMIINQYAGSGGDAMPWYFRNAKIGPLVGVRTWGGLVGIGGYPALMDGGGVTAPRIAIGGLHGQWEVEGHGIAPDIEVWQNPQLTRRGRDPQLEVAVQTAMRMLREHPVPHFAPPPYPNHHERIPR